MSNYLFWRGNSLYCCYPVPDWSRRFPLKIYRTRNTKAETSQLERQGRQLLAQIQSCVSHPEIKCKLEALLFDKKQPEEPKEYNPTYRRIARRYWCKELCKRKTGRNERYHLMHSYHKFGSKRWDEITKEEIEEWLEDMKGAGVAINTINNRLSYMKAVFSCALKESRKERRILHNPAAVVKKLSGGNERTYLLTPAKFERFYKFFCENEITVKIKSSVRILKPDVEFAKFYLALWTTGRRPLEVSSYTWSMLDIEEQGIDIPATITKTEKNDWIPVSDRLFAVLMETPVEERTGYLFKNSRGNPWYWMSDSGCLRNGCRVHMNRLKVKYPNAGWVRDNRGGFLTRNAERMDLETLMACSGHVDVRSAMRYVKKRRGKMRELVNSDSPPPVTNQSQLSIVYRKSA